MHHLVHHAPFAVYTVLTATWVAWYFTTMTTR